MRMDDAWMGGWGKDGAPMDQPAPMLIQSVELGFLLPGAEIARSCQEVAALPRFEIGVSPREGFLLSASAVQEKSALRLSGSACP